MEKTDKPFISIVSPVYKAGNIVPELVKRIDEEVSRLTNHFEIILVEDGSPDNSWKAIAEECKKNSKVKGIKLSRNFGQHYAISAGLKYAKGQWVVVMDCDLQDNPKYIQKLYQKTQEGFDIVYSRKRSREHSFFKNIFAHVFFRIFNYLTDNQTADPNIGSYSLLSRKTVDAFNSVPDHHRHYLMILRILGFKSAIIEIEHEKRFAGKSSYDFKKLIKHGIDGITSQSDKLLILSVKIGFAFCAISMIWAIVVILRYFLIGALAGYTSLMALMLLGTGLILMAIGIAGIYIGKIFEQVKNRPLYFVEEEINLVQE